MATVGIDATTSIEAIPMSNVMILCRAAVIKPLQIFGLEFSQLA